MQQLKSCVMQLNTNNQIRRDHNMTTPRKRREGMAHCAKCGTTHTSVNFHEDGTLVTPDDRPDLVRDILTAYAAIDGHASSSDVTDATCPRPAERTGPARIVDLRTRTGRAWIERKVLVSSIELDLCDLGLMRVVDEPCGQYSWGMTITDDGRAWLAAHPEAS